MQDKDRFGNRPTSDDSFWDISRRVKTNSSKATPTQKAPFSPSIQLATVRAGETKSNQEQERHVLRFADEYVSYNTYSMADNSFIESVTIRTRHNTGTFYRQFLTDAQRLLPVTASACPYAPFFSYMPQYSQMSKEQLAYYLYWRGQIKEGHYLKCDESYLLLLVYELINLGGSLIDENAALLTLCHLWREYGPLFPKLHKYLALWISDFAMVHRLRVPIKELRPVMRAVVEQAALKELYLGSFEELSLDSTELFLALFSDYDWRTSRYAKGETAEQFEQHITKSLFAFLGLLLRSGAFPIEKEEKTTLSHDAYCGAIWAHETRYAIQCVYHPFAYASTLRTVVTNAVKYSENLLRARLGLRSRLSVGPLDEEYKRVIDTYYRVICPPAKVGRAEAPKAPAYEALYDAAEHGITSARAEEIERASWDTTRRLIPEDELDEQLEQHTAPAPTKETSENTVFTSQMIAFMRALVDGDETGGLPRGIADPLVEKINEISYDCMGDIAIEQDEYGYHIVTDYLDEVMTWIEI